MRVRVARFLAAAFGISAGLFAGAAVVSPVAAVPFPVFAGLALLFWHHHRVGVQVQTGRRRRRVAGDQRQTTSDRQRTTNGAGGRDRGMAAMEAREVLGVDASASPAEIERAYRERVKEVHPDQGGDEEAFKRVREAYEQLGSGES